MSLITLSICLDDLDRSKFTTAKNGKKYLNITLSKRKDVGKYGDTHLVKYSQSKQDKENKVQAEYVKGATAKEYVFGGNNGGYSKPDHSAQLSQHNPSDLPF